IMTGGTQPRDVIQREAGLERKRTVRHETPTDIDRRPDAEAAAIRSAPAADVTVLSAEIDADFILGCSRPAPLRERDVRKRQQRDSRHDTTHEFAHYRTLQKGTVTCQRSSRP